METIYKYTIKIGEPETEMPKDAEILTVAFQGESMCFWAKVDPANETETRSFYAFGTGHEIPCGMGMDHQYIGTGFMHSGLVFHAFERLGL